jgi:sugar fermentation stimulation protein A
MGATKARVELMVDEPGVYQLHLYLPKRARVKVGKLGVFLFPAGRYIYSGSALGGLARRVGRHRRQAKRLHWHIDYLLRYARIERIETIPTRQRLECALNAQALDQPGARVIVNGFGASDCRCRAHLVYLGELDTC